MINIDGEREGRERCRYREPGWGSLEGVLTPNTQDLHRITVVIHGNLPGCIENSRHLISPLLLPVFR